jgi:hypothetical protein
MTTEININKMLNIYKRIIENKVDIKNKLNKLLFFILILFFPINQQYHIRPFPSVDGFIIDYLITKISIVELLIFSIFLINFKDLITYFKSIYKNILFWIFILLTIQSILRSGYTYLAIYQNISLFIVIFIGILLFKREGLLNSNLLVISIKSWIVLLSLLGFSQFYFQESVFDNYALTGEFPYSSDYYHIKQKNFIFGNLIPPYAIFSHSNIFGAYLILLMIFLNVLKKDSLFFYLLILLDLLLIGSAACLLAFVVYVISLYLKDRFIMVLIPGLLVISFTFISLHSFNFSDYKEDPSIYRRLYMFDLSTTYFLNDPVIFYFGSGYGNYFRIVKNDLYVYEIIRFFQPTHFSFFWVIWNYGFLFLLTLFYLIYANYKNLSSNFLRIILVLTIFSIFDHYLVTNHQLRNLLMLLIPYSLKFKNSI